MEKQIKKRRGFYSGSIRLDPDTMEEPDADNENVADIWFNGVMNDEDFLEETTEEVKDWEKTLLTVLTEEQLSKLVVYISGESHLDMAYKWRYEQTKKKSILTMKKAVFHSDRFPDTFTFFCSSPVQFDWIKTLDPSLFEKIKEKVKSGNIELVGGAWNEADNSMPSGEAFIRQRLYGMKFYKEEFDVLPEVAYYPDCFGFNVGLPQIFAKSGVKYFFTNKMTWCKDNLFPLIHFHWQSPDGSTILVGLDSHGKKFYERWENYGKTRYSLKSDAKKEWSYKDDLDEYPTHLDTSKPFLGIPLFLGKGDGGHGPTHQEVTRMIGYTNPEVQKHVKMNIKWGGLHKYFRETVEKEEPLPIWKDEMYLEDHRGTKSVHGPIKRQNRYYDNEIPAVETLLTLRILSDSNLNLKNDYPYESLQKLWKIHLLNQFHDVLPGSSVPEVFDDLVEIWPQLYGMVKKAYGTALQLNLNEIFKDLNKIHEIGSVKDLSGGTVEMYLYNPLSWERTERLFIPYISENGDAPPPAIFHYNIGVEEKNVQCQPICAEPSDLMQNNPSGWWTIITIPAYGIIKGALIFEGLEECQQPYAQFEYLIGTDIGSETAISNGITTVEFSSKTGGITKLSSVTVNNDGNLIEDGTDTSNLAIGFLDKNDVYAEWNLHPEYWNHNLNYSQEDSVEFFVRDIGPIFITLEIKRKLAEHDVIQSIQLFKDDPKVYCLWSTDWKEKNVMLKIPITTNIDTDYTTSDQMLCAIQQETKPKTKWQTSRFERLTHQYVDLSMNDNSYGLAFLNEGKYAYDTLNPKEIRFTLHRSPEYPDPTAESWVNQERAKRKEEEGTEVPTNAGIEKVSCRYSYYPHSNGALVDKESNPSPIVKKEAECFNNPLKAFSKENNGISEMTDNAFEGIALKEYDLLRKDLLNLNLPSNVILKTLKPFEWEENCNNSIVLRYVEICGQENTRIEGSFGESLQQKIKSVVAVDFLEREISNDNFNYNKETGVLSYDIKQFEAFSIKLSF